MCCPLNTLGTGGMGKGVILYTVVYSVSTVCGVDKQHYCWLFFDTPHEE